MRKIISVGLTILLLGSCGVIPQLTVKPRRYQKGLFVQLNFPKDKTQIIRYKQEKSAIKYLPSIKTNSMFVNWWTMHKEGTAALPTIHQITLANTENLHGGKNTEDLTTQSSNMPLMFPYPINTDKIQKITNSNLRPVAANSDESLSLLSLLLGIGGFVLMLLGGIIPYIGILSLLAFIAGLIIGIIALNKEGSNAKAIIGVVLSSIGCLIWGILVLLAGVVILTILALA